MAYKEIKLNPGEASSLYGLINQPPKKTSAKSGKPAAKKSTGGKKSSK